MVYSLRAAGVQSMNGSTREHLDHGSEGAPSVVLYEELEQTVLQAMRHAMLRIDSAILPTSFNTVWSVQLFSSRL